MKITPGVSFESMHKKAENKIAGIERKIDKLYKIRDALLEFTRYCSRRKKLKNVNLYTLLKRKVFPVINSNKKHTTKKPSRK